MAESMERFFRLFCEPEGSGDRLEEKICIDSTTEAAAAGITLSLGSIIAYPIVRQFVPHDRQTNEKSCKAHTLIFSSTNNLLLH